MTKFYEKFFTPKPASGKPNCSRLVDSFPDLSPKARDILMTIGEEETDARGVKQLLKKYEEFGELIIVLLNTRFYNLPEPVNSLRQAFQNPGPTAVLELALLLALIDPLFEAKDSDDLKSFWKHSFGCGCIGRFIGEKTELENAGKIFIAGLFHDLGKLVLNRNYPIDFLKIINFIKENNVSFFEAEEAVIGITHCEIGAEVARKWNLAPEITEVLQYHHAIDSATKNPTLVMLINLANLIVRTHYAGFELLEGLPVSLEELNEQQSWEIFLKKNHPQSKFDLEAFFDEVETKLDRIDYLIEDIFEIIR